MPVYANNAGSSPIESYELGEDSIEIRFRRQRRRPARTYLYTAASTAALNSLIELATAGSGLATFIARERPDHAGRW